MHKRGVKADPETKAKCGCQICASNLPFDIPEPLYEALCKQELVVFAGAGISTESKRVMPDSFYADICARLNLIPDASLDFAEVMERYSKIYGRQDLIRKIRDRFEYMRAFPEVRRWATRFHNEIATVPFLQDIVTTNWDLLFEEECQAIPLVTAEDLSFWNLRERKVLKIHGSIANIGSLIATTADYKRCQKALQSKTLGASLKMLLATKTVAFFGYSLSDSDFNQIYTALKKEMKDLLPRAYVIAHTVESADLFRQRGFKTIHTDAGFFWHSIKNRLVAENLMIADERFDGVYRTHLTVQRAHGELRRALPMHKHPESILCAIYQDGLMHGFERIAALKNSGKYSDDHRLHHTTSYYAEKAETLKHQHNYIDAAYADGYLDSLLYFRLSDEERAHFTPFYVYGSDLDVPDLKTFKRLSKLFLRKQPRVFKALTKFSARLGDGIGYHHSPWF